MNTTMTAQRLLLPLSISFQLALFHQVGAFVARDGLITSSESANRQLYSEPVERSVERRSVSDYMGGHHAGKFDFDSRLSGVTALNYEKSVIDFGQEGIKSGPILAKVEDATEVPKWAMRRVDIEQAVALREPIHFDGDDTASVTIQNEERTWEPFYASIESVSGPNVSGLQISPSSGSLAPRGGANNACDECRPYADMWDIAVRKSGDVAAGSDVFLVMRTECDCWAWRIIL